MSQSSNTIEVYLEVGKKRIFAGAIDWPGWCRIGRDETAALQALAESGPRYARVLHAAQIAFHAPTDLSAFAVIERLEGNTTTDFGAPDVAPSSDARPIDGADLRRFQMLLQAYWQAFDAAVQASARKELRKGPRGGGRDVEAIIEHVLGAEAAYLSRLAWKREKHADKDLNTELDQTHRAVLDALAAAARGELPARGPRGGVIWSPRYFVRRVAWHVLDHLWEIEDRTVL
jgi:hypothetical protein